MRKIIKIKFERAAELDENYIVFTTKTSELRDITIPLDANPRKPSKSNKNVKAMIKQIEEDPTNFRMKNEGITIIAGKAIIDNVNNVIMMEIESGQGIANGGHTYYVCNNYGVDEAKVRIEVNIGVPSKMTTEMASCRNSSKKLDVESELHHQGKFEWIKESIPSELKEDIIFYEGDDGSIKVGEVLQVLNIITPGASTIKNAKKSYNSKGAILTSLKNHGNNAPIVKVKDNIEIMWELYNYIRTDEELRERFNPMIYEDNIMYKGVAFYILAGVLQRRVENDGEKISITTSKENIKDIIAMKTNDINQKIMKLGQHFVGAIDSMVASDTFVDGIEIVFLR